MTNFPVTLSTTQAIAPHHAETVGTHVRSTEAPLPHVARNFHRSLPRISATNSTHLAEQKNLVVLSCHEATSVTLPTFRPSIHLSMTPGLFVKAQRAINRRPFSMSESTVPTMRKSTNHPHTFGIFEPTILAIKVPAEHRNFHVTASTTLQHRERAHRSMLVNANTHTALGTEHIRPKRLTITEAGTPKVGHHSPRRFGLAETTQAKRHSNVLKPNKLVEHPTITQAHLPTKRLRLTESPHPIAHSRFNKIWRLTESTSLAPVKRVTHIVRPTSEITNLRLRKRPNIVPDIREHVQPIVHKLTHHQPFAIHETTHAKRTTRLNRRLRSTQSTQTRMGRKFLTFAIPVLGHTSIGVNGSNLVRRTVPIMGVVYEPIDVYDSQVPVVAELQDFYYWLNDDDVPTLYWGPNPLSSDTTNDTYNFWKTK